MGFEFIKKLPTPDEIRNQYPIDAKIKALKEKRDSEIRDLLTGKSDKFLAIIGPCSAIFRMLATDGDIEEKIMYNTFNMGIGMVLAVDSKDVDTVLAAVEKAGEKGYVIGQVEAGEKGVTLV